jgi:hypothetical protein
VGHGFWEFGGGLVALRSPDWGVEVADSREVVLEALKSLAGVSESSRFSDSSY